MTQTDLDPSTTDAPNERDRYGIADQLARAFEWSLGGVDLDPFFDPGQALRCAYGYSLHLALGASTAGPVILRNDALDGRPWDAPSCRTVYSNPKFSGGGTRKAIRLLHDLMGSGRCEASIFVGPANLGSAYWREHGHPSLAAVAHLGRYDFLPLVDMPATSKAKARKKGERSSGGSAVEVAAALMLGPGPRANLRHYVDRFDASMRSLGVACTFARGV